MSVFNQYMQTEAGKAFALKYRDEKPNESVYCIICGAAQSKELYRMGPFRALQCKQCRTKYVSPRFDDNQLDEHYSEALFTQSKDYEGVSHNMLDPAERARKRGDMREEIEVVLGRFPKGGRVLDIGCQTGIFLEALPDKYEKFGVERSTWAAEHCRKIVNASIQTGKIEDIDYKENFFDVINISYVVEHLQYPLATLRKITPWLKDNGVLVISVPNFASYCAKIFREFYRLADPRQHIYLTDPDGLRYLLSELDFQIDSTYFPYWRTPYCSSKQLIRLFANSFRRIFLPVMLKGKCIPKIENVISPPFWGNIMTVVATRKKK